MEEKFVNYLESIGITKALMPRIEWVIAALERISGEKTIDIFISEYIQEDGSRFYEDLRAFSENYHTVALRFLHDVRYGIWNRNTKRLNVINFEVSNYDFRSSSPDSRAIFLCSFVVGKSLSLKASQNNCDKLFAIYKDYLMSMLG